MGDTLARCTMGLPKLTQISHKVLPFLHSIWDRSGKPGRSNDTISKGSVDVKGGKGEEVFMAERCEDLEGLDEKREETEKRNCR